MHCLVYYQNDQFICNYVIHIYVSTYLIDLEIFPYFTYVLSLMST